MREEEPLLSERAALGSGTPIADTLPPRVPSDRP